MIRSLLISMILLTWISFSNAAMVQVNGANNRHKIPDFAKTPTISTVSNGDWSNPATWDQNRLPEPGEVVLIKLQHSVKYDLISEDFIAAIGVKGNLYAANDKDLVLKVGTILVYPEGSLDLGDKTSPLSNNVDIIFKDQPLATRQPDQNTGVVDPEQYGNGLIAFGKLNINGQPKTAWLRLSKEPKAGDTSIELDKIPTGWNSGDEIVLPDTRQHVIKRKATRDPVIKILMQIEKRIVSSINGKVVSFSEPLQHDHLGAKDMAGVQFGMPHIVNLTRNITFRS